MFKKRTLKGSNFAQDMGAIGTSNPKVPTSDDVEEPVIQKKVKTTTGTKYSTKEQTEEYEAMTNEYIDDLKFKATSELLTRDKGNAFAHREIDTEEEHDARAVKLRQLQLSKDIKAGKVDTKYYKGESGYAIYAEKSEKDISNSKYTGTLGPIRAPSNIRATVRIDYNPSLCKDWHDTGYCGFGDSCIYIHDRGDYKSGWELEKEWEQEQAEKAKRFSVTTSGAHINEDEEQQEEDDGIPRKCQICEEDFRSPVVTTCKHYFCEKCIFDSFRQSKLCPVCSRPLNGNFNAATDVLARDRAEGKAEAWKKKKGERIVLNKSEGGNKPGKKETEDEGGLEGVDFGGGEDEEEKEGDEEQEEHDHDHDHDHAHEHGHKHGKHGHKHGKDKQEEEEVDIEKLADEFNSEVRQQKKFTIQSDWLY